MTEKDRVLFKTLHMRVVKQGVIAAVHWHESREYRQFGNWLYKVVLDDGKVRWAFGDELLLDK